MDPTDPTSRSLDSLARHGHPELREHLRRTSQQLSQVVPSVVALSISKVIDGAMVTLVASSSLAPVLDAMQYLDGGPCLESVEHDSVIVADETDPLSEQRWSLFARASAEQGIRASLSIPLVESGDVVGGVNVYAAAVNAFEGRVEDIAELLQAWAPGAVRDADLAFTRRSAAATSAAMLARRDEKVNRAVAIIAQVKQVDTQTARRMLVDSAHRAGISEAEVARTIVVLHDDRR